MSMLAEPRRKQKVINLRAKNSIWSNDPNKFGQKMLEKMGWSSGKGLGANEDGIVEHVVALYKNDEKGLGYEDRNDQWTKHEDDFNALLANLSNDSESTEKTHSGISLEVKSKKSKTRVHYHKFTRGKDVSRYSEKDLANIFGKKTLKKVEPTEEVDQSKDIKITEQIFTVSGSMDDYFKNKFSALKSRISKPAETYDNDLDFGFKGFQGTENSNLGSDQIKSISSVHPFSFYNNDLKSCAITGSTIEKSDDITPSEIKIKKKKKSKNNNMSAAVNEINTNNNINSVGNNTELEINLTKKKKHKKGKKQPDCISENHEISNTAVVNDTAVTEINYKKKSKKLKISDQRTSNNSDNNSNTNKKRKKEVINNEEAISMEEVTVPKKKKKRKQC